MTTSPRIAPLPREEFGEDVRVALSDGFSPKVAEQFMSQDPGAPEVPTVVATLMRHPALAGPFLAYNTRLLSGPALDARTRELVVLRVAWRTQSDYEWAQHVRLAPRCDISAEDVDAVTGPIDIERWSPIESAVLEAADELIADYRVSDATWRRLTEHFDDRQLIELLFVVGCYTGLAMAFNSFGLQLDAELASLPTLPPPDHED